MTIGTFDTATVLDTSKQGLALSGRLQSAAERYESEAAKLQAQETELLSKLEKTPETALATVFFRLERDIELLRLESGHLRERMRAEIEMSRKFYRDQLLTEVQTIVQTLASELGLTAVFACPNDAVVYADAKCDLTTQIIQRLDAGQ